MSRIPSQQIVSSSILDRLVNPDEKQALNKSPGQALRDLKQAVRRDLENLLNTRWRCKSWPPELPELDCSLVNYGIPDFSGANLGASAAREEFRRIVERAIRDYEPRFVRGKVKVTVIPNRDSYDRTLRFRIDAVLRAEPVPEPVMFNTALEPASSTFTVARVER